MKIKYENSAISAEIEIKDEFLRQRYSERKDYVSDQFIAQLQTVMGNLYLSKEAQRAFNEFELKVASLRVEMIKKIRNEESIDRIVDPDKLN